MNKFVLKDLDILNRRKLDDNFGLVATLCFYLSSYSIRMGSTDTKNRALERKIKSIYIHPEYKNNQNQFDVGIIEFDKAIEFNDYINQVCLPYLPMDSEQYKEYDRLTISGHYTLESCNASETVASMEISSHQVS